MKRFIGLFLLLIAVAIVVAYYENQLVEFSLQNRQALDLIRDQLRIIYPKPTVRASHPLIAITDAGAQLIKAQGRADSKNRLGTTWFSLWQYR
jgi:hypothetical protein